MNRNTCLITVTDRESAAATGKLAELRAVAVPNSKLAQYIAKEQMNGLAMPESPLWEMAMEEIRRGDWPAYLSRFGSHLRPYAFLTVFHRMDDQTYWHQLRNIWMSADHAEDDFALWDLFFFGMHHIASAQAMMNAEEIQALADLPPRFTIYRGQRHVSAHLPFCWTLCESVAEFFAQDYRVRFPDEPAVNYDAHAAASNRQKESDVLAYFADRKEQTIILPKRSGHRNPHDDPKGVRTHRPSCTLGASRHRGRELRFATTALHNTCPKKQPKKRIHMQSNNQNAPVNSEDFDENSDNGPKPITLGAALASIQAGYNLEIYRSGSEVILSATTGMRKYSTQPISIGHVRRSLSIPTMAIDLGFAPALLELVHTDRSRAAAAVARSPANTGDSLTID